MSSPSPLISFTAAGKQLGFSRQSVRRLCDRGALPVVRLPGCRPRLVGEHLANLIVSCTQTATKQAG